MAEDREDIVTRNALKTKHPWHALGIEETLKAMDSDPGIGLTEDTVLERMERYGPNVLTRKKEKSPLVRFLLQFNQPLVYILLAAGIVTLFLHEYVDAGVILGVVLVNAVVGFIQESKAIKSLSALARSMVAQVTVVREGAERRIPSPELVPGDIVTVVSGDKVAADLRLLSARELQINESALTGESLPVQKQADVLETGTVLADRVNMLYASTLVTFGQGRAVVVATGDDTEMGHISGLIQAVEELETPLTRKIASFSHVLLYVILGLAGITFLMGVTRGEPAIDIFMAAVALAVGAIPEGLPAAVTITLAIGVSRMAARRAIIRKLPAVETLGSTTVICSDKTGTLTENQMTVQELCAGLEQFTVTGSGYSPAGAILRGKVAADPGSSLPLRECLSAGCLCNDSSIKRVDDRFEVTGDPTEGALIVSARKAGIRQEQLRERFPRLDAIPFESQRQYMATLHQDRETGRRVIYVKGSFEKVLELCDRQLAADGTPRPLSEGDIAGTADGMAAKGLRVLAFALKDAPEGMAELRPDDIETGFAFLGLQGMIDPPRAEAVRAVQTCRAAGIRVKMITGDHALTAAAIAGQIGLSTSCEGGDGSTACPALTGRQMEELPDDALRDRVERTVVFARTTPEQKLRLVRTLQSRGNIVAMTGDGVNDAPALKQSDIGIAMGRTGTEVAKEAADMVLTDDNFATIEAAIEEGRGVFDNLRKFIVWTLPTNLGEGLAIMVAIFAGVTLPILPVQILWINMTTALFLGMALAFEPGEPDIMKRPPLDPGLPIMTRELVIRTIWVGIMLVAGIYWLFGYEQRVGASLAEARTTAVGVLVMGEVFYLFNCRSLDKSAFSVGIFSNPWAIVGMVVMTALQLLFTYAPVMNTFFGSAPITPASWIRITLAGLFIYAAVGIEKWVWHSARARRHPDGARQAA